MKRVRYPLERPVDGQDHEGQPDVTEHDPHGEVRVGDVRRAEAEALGGPVERPVLGEDDYPRVDAGEVARPQGEQHGHEQRVAHPAGGHSAP